MAAIRGRTITTFGQLFPGLAGGTTVVTTAFVTLTKKRADTSVSIDERRKIDLTKSGDADLTVKDE